MAEVLNRENQATEEAEAAAFSEAPPLPRKKKKNKKKIIRRIVTLVILAALVGGGVFAWKTLRSGDGEGEGQVLTDIVSRGSITSMVEGSGAAVAKNSASVTLLSGGTVRELYVSEGDYVTEGTLLYEIDSTEVEESVTRARDRVREQERALAERQEELSKYLAKAVDADATAEYAGILSDVKKQETGDSVEKDFVFAKLVDNTRLRLTLYFSYAYENDVYIGQRAAVSIPVVMSKLDGTVHEIHKVERISPEGSRLFEVVIAVDNPGTLTEGMEATATLAGGETLYPYEAGKLEYFRSTEIKAPLAGNVTYFHARDYQKVAAGESIAHIHADDEDREAELKSLRDRVEDAQDALKEAQKALDKELESLDSLSASAPIDGTVLSLGISQGEEVKSGTVAVSIADTTTMIVNAEIDEMNVSYAQVGMPVEISLWGDTQTYGVIESVSLSAKSENGVARFPMVISVDNSDGAILSGAYVRYQFTASQNDDCLLVPIQCVKYVETEAGTQKVLFIKSDFPPENTVEVLSDTSDIPEGYWPVAVETGISDSYNVEIISGAEEFQTVYMSKVMTEMW